MSMRTWQRSLLVGMALFASAGADTVSKITMKDLEKQGVYTRNFSVYHVAGDGRTILAGDEPDFTLKKKGPLNRLVLLRLSSDLKLETVRIYPLTVPTVEQANFSPDLKSVLISSRKGAFIDKLDLESGQIEPLMHHTSGQAGFRIHSEIFSWWGSKLYTIGYFYDAEDFSGDDEMVEIDTDKSGPAAFTPVLKLGEIQKQLPGHWKISSALHPSAVFHYIQSANRWSIYRWNANGSKKIDEGKEVTGSWGEGPRALYTITRDSDATEVVLNNGQTEENRIVYSGPNQFLNPCLSKEGNTLAVALPTGPNQAEYWIGQDSGQFQLHKVIDKMPASTIRISHDGGVVSLYNGITGITLIKLSI